MLAYNHATRNEAKITYDRRYGITPTAMVDADWSVECSTAGWVVFLAGAAVMAASRKIMCMALSTTEAELIAASMAAADVVPSLPARGYGAVLPVSYEQLCTSPRPTLLGMCAFLGLECSEQYVSAVAAFLRVPHENWQSIRWEGDVSLQRIADMLAQQPPALLLGEYPMPQGPAEA